MTEQLKALAEAAKNSSSLATKEYRAFSTFATPERILALIAENERIRKANDSLKTEVSDVYASNTGYRLELERVRGLIRQHLIHHEHGCVYLDEALGETK